MAGPIMAQSTETNASRYLQAVQQFADSVLANGRDVYGEVHSPLFVDGINPKTGEPVRWEYEGGGWIISNFASQQNLMRTLVGLSALTSDSKYREAAAEATAYMFQNHTDSRGLLHWGGHQFVDVQTMENRFKNRPHELKNNYPFYEFMWEVDSVATRNMLRAIWNAHILDWGKLDMNRHGEYDAEMGKLWNHKFEHPKPFFEGEGLTFINAGTDMIQAGMSLYFLSGEEEAKSWSMRLYRQYVQARHPETNLGVYQFSKSKQRDNPPASGPLTGELTFSNYGDRAQNQFGAVYGDVALEGNVLWGGRMETLYGRSPVMLLHIAEHLKNDEAGRLLQREVIKGLRAYIKHGYEPGQNHFRPMWADGTDLSGQTMPRTGYYGKRGTPFPCQQPTGPMMLALAKAVHQTEGDSILWQALRQQFIAAELGDPGVSYKGKAGLNLNAQTDTADANLLAVVLELYEGNRNPDFLKLAEQIGDNILQQKFKDGYFRPASNFVYTKLDRPEPLVLLMLEAARRQKWNRVPAYVTGEGSTDGEPALGGRPSDEYFYREQY